MYKYCSYDLQQQIPQPIMRERKQKHFNQSTHPKPSLGSIEIEANQIVEVHEQECRNETKISTSVVVVMNTDVEIASDSRTFCSSDL